MSKLNTNLVTVIIPIYNEEEGIPSLVDSLNQFFEEQDYSTEIIFVNDGSKDKTAEILLNARHFHYKAKLINLSRNFGSHAALRAGIQSASGSYVCFNYADLQDPLELVTKMKALIDGGSQIVWATREKTKQRFSEKLFFTRLRHANEAVRIFKLSGKRI
jgi:polyisoprenyl-phosphate glycosyltransferase